MKGKMRKKTYMRRLVLLAGIILISCDPAKKASNEMVRNLNPSEEPLQETPAYDNVKIIKLETSPTCLLGNVMRIEMNDSFIFVSEYGKLYTFTKEGKFVAKIGGKGQGPHEYITLSTFYVDNENQTITIIDEFKNVLINYDFAGKHLSTISVPKNAFEGCSYALLVSKDKLLVYNMMGLNNTKAYSLFDLEKKEICEKYFPYNPITIGDYMYSFSWHPMAKTGKDVDVILPLCDTIYSYSVETSSFHAKYIIETPQKMASKDLIRKNTPSYNEDVCKLAEQGFFIGFNGIFETDTKVLLGYEYQGVVQGYFLFDKLSKTGRYYLGSWDNEDAMLPFFPIIYAYKNTFVGCVEPRSLLELKNIQDAQVLESMKGLEEDDNPCLILYEFK